MLLMDLGNTQTLISKIFLRDLSVCKRFLLFLVVIGPSSIRGASLNLQKPQKPILCEVFICSFWLTSKTL